VVWGVELRDDDLFHGILRGFALVEVRGRREREHCREVCQNGPVKRDRIVLVNGHPDRESFCFALHAAYKRGALASGATVEEIVIRDLEFAPNLEYGYRKRTELEPDLLRAQELIRWANHLVFIHPVWWGSFPSVMKGFLDRVFLPGFFFKKRPDSGSHDKLLTGRSARIIYTLDTPRILWWLAGRPSWNALKWMTLSYCGVSPVRGTTLGIVLSSTRAQRARWLVQVEALGARRG
jgi:NAD(P)H dehydrogenase (quinone)